MKRSFFLLFSLLAGLFVRSQVLMDMVDTSKTIGKGIFSIYQKYDRLHVTGYIQPQFQVAGSQGAHSYDGGDFALHANNRFMLRRGRFKFEYVRLSNEKHPSLQMVLQVDATERGVSIRDFYGKVFENKWQLFSLTTGMFVRPFGYELHLSSSDRESPERIRMSQILMRGERDLGVMVSLEPRNRGNLLKYLKIDAGLFNGQGLTATTDFDSYKDLITRAGIHHVSLGKNILFSAGVSHFNGGFYQNNKYVYRTAQSPLRFEIDSSVSNIGKKAPRIYYGLDIQTKWKHGWGATEVRGEYWWGTQTATASTSETPNMLLLEPYYIRKFRGGYLYFIQNIINAHHQLVLKYDWYDPNKEVSESAISSQNHFTPADIRYTTLATGYINYINENLKLVLWYEWVKNEKTVLPGFTDDLKDNILTVRLQFKF